MMAKIIMPMGTLKNPDLVVPYEHTCRLMPYHVVPICFVMQTLFVAGLLGYAPNNSRLQDYTVLGSCWAGNSTYHPAPPPWVGKL